MLGAPHPSVYFLCWEPSHKGSSQSRDLTHGRPLNLGFLTSLYFSPEALHICGPSHLEPFTHGSSHTWEPSPLGRRRGCPIPRNLHTWQFSHLGTLTSGIAHTCFFMWEPHIWDSLGMGTLTPGVPNTPGFFISGNPSTWKRFTPEGSPQMGLLTPENPNT